MTRSLRLIALAISKNRPWRTSGGDHSTLFARLRLAAKIGVCIGLGLLGLIGASNLAEHWPTVWAALQHWTLTYRPILASISGLLFSNLLWETIKWAVRSAGFRKDNSTLRVAALAIALSPLRSVADRRSLLQEIVSANDGRIRNLQLLSVWRVARRKQSVINRRHAAAERRHRGHDQGPARLYIATSENLGAIKIGVTQGSKRLDQLMRSGWSTIGTWETPNPDDARAIEQEILRTWRVEGLPNGTSKAEMPYGGFSETAPQSLVDLHRLLDLVTSLVRKVRKQ